MYRYLKQYLNLLDFIAVEDSRVAETLRLEEVDRPEICMISLEKGTQKESASAWLGLYEKCLPPCCLNFV